MPTTSRRQREGSIEASRLWKRFRTDKGPPTVRDRLRLARGRLTGKTHRGWRWALRDVDFHAEPGESIGLVGHNGGGKSTLLKLLTRVMHPYAGSVAVTGRVGALIEVRAGIHPELTGRENAFLYGSLLGLGRRAIADRFDAIVEFAELERAIDRQVKFYSTGMQMRLGFAVAAFLEPDVLLVDEVLAVGDAAFQQRCLERMRQVLAGGTTLVLVSHDLAAVEAMCQRSLWLRDGVLTADGSSREVLAAYRASVQDLADSYGTVESRVRLRKVEAASEDGSFPATLRDLRITMTIDSQDFAEGRLYVGISEGTATPTFVVSRMLHLPMGQSEATCVIGRLPLPRGRYYVWASMVARDDSELMPWHRTISVDVSGPDAEDAPVGVVRPSSLYVRSDWQGDCL